ncbi:MAG: hypothetical protein N2689_15995 [Verrucomicrobiae bacterium]|nr:hypothetical protein [Verrucomicrobiae bacterium]
MTANSVSVKGVVKGQSRLRTVNFTIPTDVKIVRNGQPCAMKDIQKGDSVSVSFVCKPGSSLRRVSEIEVGKSGSQ